MQPLHSLGVPPSAGLSAPFSLPCAYAALTVISVLLCMLVMVLPGSFYAVYALFCLYCCLSLSPSACVFFFAFASGIGGSPQVAAVVPPVPREI